MAKSHRTTPPSDTLTRAKLFGPPPIIEGENGEDYQKLFERVFDAIEPADFIEEIWARDLADVTWSMFRLRRILAATLNDEVWDKVNDEASERARENAKFLEGTEKEKEEMDRLIDPDSEYSWEVLIEQNPRAFKKFEVLWDKAKSDLNVDLIQARVITYNLDTIERIESLITIAQRRIDEVVRELDRHRVTRTQLKKFSPAIEATNVTQTKIITGKVIDKKVA